MKTQWIVSWKGGFLHSGEQFRAFPTKKRAEQWARMAGVYSIAKIGKELER